MCDMAIVAVKTNNNTDKKEWPFLLLKLWKV
jgi:hypothetical protein